MSLCVLHIILSHEEKKITFSIVGRDQSWQAHTCEDCPQAKLKLEREPERGQTSKNDAR